MVEYDGLQRNYIFFIIFFLNMMHAFLNNVSHLQKSMTNEQRR